MYSGGDWLSEGLKNPQAKGVSYYKGAPACLSIEDDSPVGTVVLNQEPSNRDRETA